MQLKTGGTKKEEEVRHEVERSRGGKGQEVANVMVRRYRVNTTLSGVDLAAFTCWKKWNLNSCREYMFLTMLALYVTGHVPPPADHVGLVRYRLHHHCRHLLQLATVVHVLEGSKYEQAMMTLWNDNFDLMMHDTDINNTNH